MVKKNPKKPSKPTEYSVAIGEILRSLKEYEGHEQLKILKSVINFVPISDNRYDIYSHSEIKSMIKR